jgi:UDP-N-acetyl-2-amino-2-deoxyglucuronate dehydrogenase
MNAYVGDRAIRFGIVGMGHIGKRHASILERMEGASLVAVCDIDTNIDIAVNVPIFNKVEEMLAAVEIDVVVIASPHFLHFEQTVLSLSKGVHVLVEKPMALSTREAEAMVEKARESNLKLWVVKQNRYNTPVFALEHLIKSGKLGKIYLLECQVLWNRRKEYYSDSNWRGKIQSEGGALYTHASHFIDLMTEWCGDIKDVNGFCIKRQQEIESEDVGSATLYFEQGTIGSLQWTTLAHEKNFEGSISVVGEKGTVKIGGPYLNQFDYWNVEGYPLPGISWGEDVQDEFGLYQSFGNNHDKVYQAILHELRTGLRLGIDGADGVKSIKAIELIYAKINRITT